MATETPIAGWPLPTLADDVDIEDVMAFAHLADQRLIEKVATLDDLEEAITQTEDGEWRLYYVEDIKVLMAGHSEFLYQNVSPDITVLENDVVADTGEVKVLSVPLRVYESVGIYMTGCISVNVEPSASITFEWLDQDENLPAVVGAWGFRLDGENCEVLGVLDLLVEDDVVGRDNAITVTLQDNALNNIADEYYLWFQVWINRVGTNPLPTSLDLWAFVSDYGTEGTIATFNAHGTYVEQFYEGYRVADV